MTNEMLVRLGENDVRTMEDFAGCVPDDLVGWSERKDGETVRHKGFFDGVEISREDAEAMIMTARVRAGWIEPGQEPDEAPDEAPDDETDAGDADDALPADAPLDAPSGDDGLGDDPDREAAPASN